MKKFLLILLCILMISCGKIQEKRTIEWIAKARKPITCKIYNKKTNGSTKNWYTLQSANSEFFNTRGIYMTLPDTIKY